MKIFIGSSRESLDLVREIEVWLEEKGHQPIPWDKPGLFMPGEQTFRTLMTISRDCDAAVFVFGADDTVWYRGDTVPSPRDNVLIEYGLFAGGLGPHKAIVCRNGDPKHPIDLAGLTYIDLHPNRRARGKLELAIWAQRLTTEPVDPALLQLQAKTFELERKLVAAQDQLRFQEEKSRDLEDELDRSKVIDFSSYDLSKDGHWKLLFDFDYFQGAAALLAKSVRHPAELRGLVAEAGAEAIVDGIAWHHPSTGPGVDDLNPDRNAFITRKVLRLFRVSRTWAEYHKLLQLVPPGAQSDATKLAEDSIARRSASARNAA